MSDSLSECERDLNAMILAGKAFDGFEKYYADDVVMQENTETPTVGKDANREREQAFFGSIEEFHGAELHSSAVGDNVTMSEWTFDMTMGGNRIAMAEVARRQWRDGKVVHERSTTTCPANRAGSDGI